MDDKIKVFKLEDVLPLIIVPKDGGRPYELLKFKFTGNKTNEVVVHGKTYRIELLEFWGNYRVDLYENDEFLVNIGDNTGNHSFKEMVDTSLPIHEQVIHWASRTIAQNDTCDFCGTYSIIKPLSQYDIENFPRFHDKKVCQKCRTEEYKKRLNQIDEEEKKQLQREREEMKQKGAKFHYTFWIHPNGGDDFIVDLFTNRELSAAELKQEQRKLKLEHGARMVEEPSCVEL
jgi:hypothetical protein